MSIAEKLVAVAKNEQKVYDAGFEKGREIGRQIVSRTITELIDDTLETVGSYAFYGCTAMTMVSLLSLSNIKSNGFCYCLKLKVADLGNVATIGSGAFSNCRSLNTIILRNTDVVCTVSDTSCFENSYFGTSHLGGTAYVPAALLESYQADPGWSAVYCDFLAIEGSEYE